MLSSLILTVALVTQTPLYVPIERETTATVQVKIPVEKKACSGCECGCECSVKQKLFRMKDKNGVTYEDVDKQKVIDYINYVNLNTPYQLTDKNGVVWTHTDYTYLKDYVNKVNAGTSGVACITGTCPR